MLKVEPLSNARTPLADFFNILLEVWLSPSMQWYHAPTLARRPAWILIHSDKWLPKTPRGFSVGTGWDINSSRKVAISKKQSST